MATNWSGSEAIRIIIEGTDKEAIYDITKRFPLISLAAAKNDILTIASAIPENVSMRKLESMLKGEVKEADEDQDDEEVEEKPAKKEKKEKAEKPGKKAAKVEEPEEDEDDEEDEELDYSEMSAKELYQLCKSRKIKVEQKQKPAVYIKALEKADKAAAKAAEDEEDDDDDFEDEKPAKSSKKDKKASGKKKAAEEDDDDEWEI